MVAKFGKLFRAVLNINTIWGVMIIVSLLAAGLQHMLPTTSWISPEQLKAGENQVEIRVADKDDEILSTSYTVTFDGTTIGVPEGLFKPSREISEPFLLGSTVRSDMPGLVWDCHKYGSYAILINGQKVSAGSLINLEAVTDAAFDYAKVAFNLGLGFVAVFVLFLGLMKVGEDAGIVQLVAWVLRPVINFLFPGIPKGHPASGAIVMNITTAILGLGNASTPFGLKAMEELQKLNPRKETASDAMCMLLGYNTAGFALLPTTMLALRKSAGCSDPFAIIGTCMIAGLSSTITAMLMVKLLSKLPMFRVKYTPAELAAVAEAWEKEQAEAKAAKEEENE